MDETTELLRGVIRRIYEAVEDREKWERKDATIEELQDVLKPVFRAALDPKLWKEHVT